MTVAINMAAVAQLKNPFRLRPVKFRGSRLVEK